ncbi:MAG: short-chain dehydrogenase [Bacteroidota bacterium]
MDITGKTVLVLGGWGLVGSAIVRKIIEEKPSRIILTSLLQSEAEESVAALRNEYPHLGSDYFIPWWGNIFVRYELKDKAREEILGDPSYRQMLIEDILDELTEDVLKRSSLYQLLTTYRPEIVIDCVNSATAIAYQDIFQSSRDVLQKLQAAKSGKQTQELFEATEKLLSTLYIPQLIRHVQILYQSMHTAGTKIYVKIGTSGTGGMGLNIPYTHSEERPSRVLLSKSGVAGAHTLLLFLMGRTPDAPITKEIKPTAAIAWKRIGFGEIKKRGAPVELEDCPPEQGTRLEGSFEIRTSKTFPKLGETLKSVFIDTGENGIFSRGEFEAISTPGQMEFVTPEEIAEDVIYEIKGGNTGHDIINALDNATLAPTYRAGFLFNSAITMMRKLEAEHNVRSIAFEMLGPPRLSKLLFEAHLLRSTYVTIKGILASDPREISKTLEHYIFSERRLRAEILSIGIPILLSDGKTLLRGTTVKIPPYRGENVLPITPENIDTWAHDGWVDLRVSNMERWQNRFRQIMAEVESIPAADTSSRFLHTAEYWNHFDELDEGKVVGWIFIVEEKGRRMKA